jgi:hypothetical protein
MNLRTKLTHYSFLAVYLAIPGYGAFLGIQAEASRQPVQADVVDTLHYATPQAGVPDPCTLETVVCAHEDAKGADNESSAQEQALQKSSDTRLLDVSHYSEIDSCHYPKWVGGKRKCLTASGKIAEMGMCATNLFPFGTKLMVGDRPCVVEDRISKRYAHRVDLWEGYGHQAKAKAERMGIQEQVTVRVTR